MEVGTKRSLLNILFSAAKIDKIFDLFFFTTYLCVFNKIKRNFNRTLIEA